MRRFVAACSAVLFATAVLGACGGGGSPDAESPSETKPDSTSPDINGSDGDLASRYENAANQKFKITFVNDSGDESTYAQDGKGRNSYTTGDTQIFTTSSGSVQCSTDSGGAAQCSELPGGSAATSGFLTIYTAGRAYVQALGRFGDTSSKSIAGRDATCVEFSAETAADAGPVAAAIGRAIEGSLTYCLDDETGVLLSFSNTDADGKTTDSFTVTKFEEPSDSDFTPPATPSSVSLPPGYTVPTIPGD